MKHKHLLDLSEYQSKLFDSTNKKVIGKMKDKYKRKPNSEFIGLKSKIYSILSDDGKNSNPAKRLNIALDFDEYKNILFNKKK